MEGRAKEVNSFEKKVKDKGQQYQDPIQEMPDLVGLRIVTYIVDDARATSRVIEENFDIDWDRSSIGGTDSDPDRFGYMSDHYEVRIKPERAALPEWAPFEGVWMEIQVRTVLQHAWAALSHKLQYKAEQSVPRALRRQLSRVSALLEVADKEFSELSSATAQLDAEYLAAIQDGSLDIELNADSLAAFLTVTKRHMAYRAAAESVGYATFEIEDEDVAADFSTSNFDTFAALVLEGASLTQETTLADLDSLIPDPAPQPLIDGLREILDESVGNGFLPTAVPIDMLMLAYAIAMRGGLDPTETAEMTNFVDELKEALKTALFNVE